jgi:hypothetical protein
LDKGDNRVCQDCVRAKAKGRVCSDCRETKDVDEYERKQWAVGAARLCKGCVGKGTKKPVGKKWSYITCCGCKEQKETGQFSKCPANRRKTKRARCDICIDEDEAEAKRVNTCGSMMKD